MNNLKVDARKDKFACEKCTQNFPSTVKLLAHIQIVHVSQKTTQTEETLGEDKFTQHATGYRDNFVQTFEFKIFEKYSCYYCGKDIASENDLIGHRSNCNGCVLSLSTVKTESEQCQSKWSKVGNKNSAINVYHGLLSALSQGRLAFKKFPCDACQETFESEKMLELHKMFSHPKL